MVRRRLVVLRTAAAATLCGIVLVPATGDARAAQSDGAGASQVQLDIDVQTADESSLEGAVDDISENVASQVEALGAAQDAVTTAEATLVSRQAAVAATEEEIAALTELSDEVVVRAFMNPPAESAIDVLSTSSPGDAAMKRALLTLQATEDADVLSALADTRDQLAEEQAAENEALAEAEDARADAAAALEDLQAAASQQATFVLALEQRIERGLTELENLMELDPELAEELRQQQAELTGMIEALHADHALEMAGVPPPEDHHVGGASTIEPVGGGVVVVGCPTGGSIEIAGDLSRDLQSLLNLSAENGLTMCGTGWRDPQRQIELRRRHCGSSEYAIYQAPSSACSPPTARPGTSMHERGLAVDFTCNGRGVRRGDACFVFLSNHASSYGFYNLPSEPWHWSTDGT